ncbi:MAG: sulfite exporter TauE/SafE family protein [Burkholderiales bacterium]|nr:sulfite exporter TauE/SafE family protein [Burkholderiales bacterium]
MPDWLPAGVEPFAGIAWWAIAIVFAAHAFGCFIRGAFGFGSNMPIVLITTFLLGPHHAILLALLTTIVAQVNLLPSGLKDADWEVARPLMAGLVVGTVLGTWLFTILSAEWLVLVLGILLSMIVLMDWFNVMQRLTAHVNLRSVRVASSFSFVGGTMGGLSGGGAFYFLVVYLKHACSSAAALRGTNVVLSVLVMCMRMIVVILAGRMTLTLLAEGLLLTPLVLAATWYGSHVFRTSPPARFFAALQILLLTGALALIVKGIGRLA